MNNFSQLGACASVRMHNGVMVVEWGGVVTLPAAEAVKAAICADLVAEPAAVVSDYRRAVVAMGEAELLRIMMGGQHDLPELPAAVVAPASFAPAFWRASVTTVLVSRRWRRVCQTRDEALAWALRLSTDRSRSRSVHR